jgi:hypothetical protein
VRGPSGPFPVDRLRHLDAYQTRTMLKTTFLLRPIQRREEHRPVPSVDRPGVENIGKREGVGFGKIHF